MGAHARRAVQDAFVERRSARAVNVLDSEALLEGGDAPDLIGLASDLRRAAIDDPRFVEMDMGLDQAGACQPPACVIGLRLCREVRADCDDPAVFDADIDGFAGGLIAEKHVADDEIHVAGSLIGRGSVFFTFTYGRKCTAPRIAFGLDRSRSACYFFEWRSGHQRPQSFGKSRATRTSHRSGSKARTASSASLLKIRISG